MHNKTNKVSLLVLGMAVLALVMFVTGMAFAYSAFNARDEHAFTITGSPTYSIAYHDDDDVDLVDATYSSNTLKVASKTGYTFNHWTDAHGNVYPTTTTQAELYDSVSGNLVNLYANYTAHKSSLVLDTSGGLYTGAITTITGEYGTSFTMKPTLAGYVFIGWTLSKTGGGTANGSLSGNTYSFGPTQDASDTLTAQWSLLPFEMSEDGQYIYFGSYPQTIKASNVTITDTPVDANGYYTGSDGEKYAKITALPFGDNYDEYKASDGTTMTIGTEYYFKVEPLKWRILSNDGTTAFIVCDNVLSGVADCDDIEEYCVYQRNCTHSGDYYYATDSNGNILTDNGSQVYANNYKWSDLRAWLNGYFYNKAFSSIDKAVIQTTEVDNSSESTRSTSYYVQDNPYVCENTYDKVFTLSAAELRTYMNDLSSYYEIDQSKRWYPTDYTKANFVEVDRDYLTSGFWLRSPFFDDSICASVMKDNGSYAMESYEASGSGVFGVVPALKISLA